MARQRAAERRANEYPIVAGRVGRQPQTDAGPASERTGLGEQATIAAGRSTTTMTYTGPAGAGCAPVVVEHRGHVIGLATATVLSADDMIFVTAKHAVDVNDEELNLKLASVGFHGEPHFSVEYARPGPAGSDRPQLAMLDVLAISRHPVADIAVLWCRQRPVDAGCPNPFGDWTRFLVGKPREGDLCLAMGFPRMDYEELPIEQVQATVGAPPSPGQHWLLDRELLISRGWVNQVYPEAVASGLLPSMCVESDLVAPSGVVAVQSSTRSGAYLASYQPPCPQRSMVTSWDGPHTGTPSRPPSRAPCPG